MLTDAGPLIALLDARDGGHRSCVEVVTKLRQPLVTVWPVISEVVFVLEDRLAAVEALFGMLQDGPLRLATLDSTDAPRIRELMRKYRDLPMDLADAALVRVAERDHHRRVFTLDRRHFSLYRPRGIGRFEIVP